MIPTNMRGKPVHPNTFWGGGLACRDSKHITRYLEDFGCLGEAESFDTNMIFFFCSLYLNMYIYIYYRFLYTPEKLCTCHLKPACSWVFPYLFAVLFQGQNLKNIRRTQNGGLEDDFQNWMMFRFQPLILKRCRSFRFGSLQIFI